MLHPPNDSPVEPWATMTSLRLLERALLLGTVVSPFVLFWFRSKYLWLVLVPLGCRSPKLRPAKVGCRNTLLRRRFWRGTGQENHHQY